MERSKKLNRNIFLAIGIAVGLMIFLLGSQLNINLKHAQKQEVNSEEAKQLNLIFKKFFS